MFDNSGIKEGGIPLVKSKGLAISTSTFPSRFFASACFSASILLPPCVTFSIISPKTAASAKPSKRDGKSEREAAAKYAKEERQRDKQRAKEEAEAAKAREKRNAAIEKAQAALLQAEGEHEENADAVLKTLEAVQQRVEAEEERWRKQKVRLEADLRKAKRLTNAPLACSSRDQRIDAR